MVFCGVVFCVCLFGKALGDDNCIRMFCGDVGKYRIREV